MIIRNRSDHRLPQEGDKLLIVKYSALGDVVGATSVARCLKHHYPFLHISWLVNGENAELIKDQPFIDELVIWSRSCGIKSFLSLLRDVRTREYDWLLDLQWVDRSSLISLLSCAGFKVGYHKSLKKIYDWTPGKEWADNKPLLQRQAVVAAGLGVNDCHLFPPALRIPEPEKKSADILIGHSGEPRVMAIIGASKEIKTWPMKNWLDFLNKIVEIGWIPVIVGHLQREMDMADELEKALNTEKIVNMTGKLTLRELASVVSCCDLVVGGDSGPTHIANAIGIPTVAIFGPTCPETVFPKGPKTFILKAKCPDQGCNNWNCTDYAGCLGSVSAEEVLELLNLKGII